jgi:hypothetical protein
MSALTGGGQNAGEPSAMSKKVSAAIMDGACASREKTLPMMFVLSCSCVWFYSFTYPQRTDRLMQIVLYVNQIVLLKKQSLDRSNSKVRDI